MIKIITLSWRKSQQRNSREKSWETSKVKIRIVVIHQFNMAKYKAPKKDARKIAIEKDKRKKQKHGKK